MLVEMYEMNLIVRVAEIMDICAGMRGAVISVIRTRALGGQGASTLDLRLGQGKVNVGKEGMNHFLFSEILFPPIVKLVNKRKQMVHTFLPNIYFSLAEPEVQCRCSLPPESPRPDDRDHHSPHPCTDVHYLRNPHDQICFVHLYQHHI